MKPFPVDEVYVAVTPPEVTLKVGVAPTDPARPKVVAWALALTARAASTIRIRDSSVIGFLQSIGESQKADARRTTGASL
jgi:hypothetical protein